MSYKFGFFTIQTAACPSAHLCCFLVPFIFSSQNNQDVVDICLKYLICVYGSNLSNVLSKAFTIFNEYFI